MHSEEHRQVVGKTSSLTRFVLLTLVFVVVLGGDTPYAVPAILELEKKGYIVIASVSNSAAIDILESQCKGYVKAHVLDPFEVCVMHSFVLFQVTYILTSPQQSHLSCVLSQLLCLGSFQ